MENVKNISDGMGFFCSDGFCYVRPGRCDGDYVTVNGIEYPVDENHLGKAYVRHDGQDYLLLC